MHSLMTFRQFAERHPAFTEGSLRWMRFNINGRFDSVQPAFKVLGRRVLIDEQEFFQRVTGETERPGEEARG